MATLIQLQSKRDKIKQQIKDLVKERKRIQALCDEYAQEADAADSARSDVRGCDRLDEVLSNFEMEMQDKECEYDEQVSDLDEKVEHLRGWLKLLQKQIRKKSGVLAQR